MLHKLISFKYMIISFAIGLFFVYVFGPNNKIIYINPTQDTHKEFIVEDKVGNCFHYDSNMVDCPKDDSKITTIKPQI